jgi:hypothetical protein
MTRYQEEDGVQQMYVRYQRLAAPNSFTEHSTKSIDFCIDLPSFIRGSRLLSYILTSTKYWNPDRKTPEDKDALNSCSVQFFASHIYAVPSSQIRYGAGSCHSRARYDPLRTFGREMKAINVFLTNKTRP